MIHPPRGRATLCRIGDTIMTECLWSLWLHRPPSPYCSHCSVSPLRCYHSTVRWTMRDMWGTGLLATKLENTEKTISEQGRKCRIRLAVGTRVIMLEIWFDVHHRDSSGCRSVDCVKKLNIYEKLGKKELRSASYRRYAWDVRQSYV